MSDLMLPHERKLIPGATYPTLGPWTPESAPGDGTLVRILVQFATNNFLNDGSPGDTPHWTIGENSYDLCGGPHLPFEKCWRIAGWQWGKDDGFAEAEGEVLAWLPFVPETQIGAR